MDALRDLSLGDLLDRLLADRLIDACHMTSEYVTIVQGTKRHSLAFRKARPFLVGLLGGYGSDVQTSGSQESMTPMRAVDTSGGRAETGETASTETLHSALDELLRIAGELHIIEGHERDDGSVKIALSSCETKLRDGDAVAFLVDCILHKLNEMRRAPQATSRAAGWNGGAWPFPISGSLD